MKTPATDPVESRRRLGTVAARQLTPVQLSVINAAIYLRRPLLVTGRPGAGKSSLAYLIALELGLGPVLRWPVTSRTRVRAGLYDYDAIGRAEAIAQAGHELVPHTPSSRDSTHLAKEAVPAVRRKLRPSAAGPVAPPPVGRFVTLGPLGTSLLANETPRVLLVDEFDKSDYDLPNDLLTIFEDGEFDIPELVRVRDAEPEAQVYTADRGETAPVHGGIVRAREFPVVVITSNGEREFPEAFLRRCLRLEFDIPDAEALADLVAAHFPRGSEAYQQIIDEFVARRRQGLLASDQLLNAAHLLDAGALDGDENLRRELLTAVWRRLDPVADAE